MGQKYLIDTNIVIAYLNNGLPEDIANMIDEAGSRISVITRIELLVWRNATQEQINTLQEYIDLSVVFNLDEAIILKAIEIRKQYRIKLPDVIIAATAIVHDLILITGNSSDFEKIREFQFVNPF